MTVTFAVDAADMDGGAVLGHVRLEDGAAAWHGGVEYAGFRAVKDLIRHGEDLLLLVEGEEPGARHLCRLVGGRFIAGCAFVRGINRPFCLLARGSSLLIGHVGGISALEIGSLGGGPSKTVRALDGRVLSLAEFEGRLLAAVQSTETHLTDLVDVETGSVVRSDGRDRLVSKLIVWQGRLAATDAHNAELFFPGEASSAALPLGHGYVRALCPLADGGLLVARNVWRRHSRRKGERLHQRALQPAWWDRASFLQQRASDLLVVDPGGAIRQELPFTQLAPEVSAATVSDETPTGPRDAAASARAVYQRLAQEQTVAALLGRVRRLEKSLASEAAPAADPEAD